VMVLTSVVEIEVVPPTTPVQTALTGQHATCPAPSKEQIAFDGQQAPLSPTEMQLV
jgi:hypothetical protein